MVSKWLTWTPTKTSGETVADITQKIEEVRPFPHCPRCASHTLYRKNNQGNYECESCGLKNISEEVARRVQ